MILEKIDFAKKRDARIYGTLKSLVTVGGETVMGHYEKRGEQMASAMRHSLEQADIQNSDGFPDGRSASGESSQDSTWRGSRL